MEGLVTGEVTEARNLTVVVEPVPVPDCAAEASQV
jgi:hypothetical protein